MGRSTHLLYGLRVRSEFPIAAPEVASDGVHDIDVSWGDRDPIPGVPPPGRVMALEDPETGGWAVVETESGYTIRFLKGCDFRVSADRRFVIVDVAPWFDEGLVPILLAGSVLAAVLVLQGRCVLHASGVRIYDRTIAFLGASGQGKSTLAALFCLAGAELISDDLLHLEIAGDRPSCYTGTSQIRLRSKAAAISGEFPDDARIATADGRFAVSPRQADGSLISIDAVILPHPSRQACQPSVSLLSNRDALLALVSNPRVLGLQAIDPIRQHFEACAEVANSVPVFEATIPWGPPFDPELPRMLIDALGLPAC